MSRSVVLLASLCFLSATAHAQEGGAAGNCDDLNDNDANGYVDIYDDECRDAVASCSFAPSPPVFSIERAGTYANVEDLFWPVVADVDADGETEIVVAHRSRGRIEILDGATLALESFIAINGDRGDSFAVGNLDSDPELELVTLIHRVNNMLVADLNPATGTWVVNRSTSTAYDCGGNVGSGMGISLADFNGDGQAEIHYGNEIWTVPSDLTTGCANCITKRIDTDSVAGGGAKGCVDLGSGPQGMVSVAADVLSRADCAGSAECDGLELIAAHQVFSVDVMTGAATLRRDMASRGAYRDGFTQAADINGDGVLNIIVHGQSPAGNLYAYEPRTLTLVSQWNLSGGGSHGYSPVAIADVWDEDLADDGDTTNDSVTNVPELIVTRIRRMYAVNVRSATPVWSLTTSDSSGSTSASIYDFNGDGIKEIAYRDTTQFRVMYGGPTAGGLAPVGVDANRNYRAISCPSPTMNEGPTIADLDGDGRVEIATTCNFTFTIFESDTWRSARPVWTQSIFTPHTINDDGEIYPVPQNTLANIPSGSTARPLNVSLTQLSVDDLSGTEPGRVPAIDVRATDARVVATDCGSGRVTAHVTIANEGAATATGALPIAFYLGDPGLGGTLVSTRALATGAVTGGTLPLAPGSSVSLSFSLTGVPAGTRVFMSLNDDGTGAARPSVVEPECDITDNLTDAGVCGPDDLCVDDMPAGAVDTGCNMATPACDVAASPSVCVECVDAGDCADGVCDPMTGSCATCVDSSMAAMVDDGCTPAAPICADEVCAPCVDTLGGGGVDLGCDASAPLCTGTGAAATCLPCTDTAAGSAIDDGCTGVSPICSGAGAGAMCVGCIDTGAAVDLGCSASIPVCDSGMCVACVDTGSGVDSGCSPVAPVCDGTGCVPCEDTMAGAGQDDGCDVGAPLCAGSGSAARCLACEDTGEAVTDLGCGGGAPVCAEGATNICVPCEDSAAMGTDFGCSAEQPLCDDRGATPICVACVDDGTCDDGDPCTADSCDSRGGCVNEALPVGSRCDATRVCDSAGACVACIDDLARGRDTGCVSASPVCDLVDGSLACVPCADDTDGRLDDGCGLAAPVCDEDATCLACEDSAPAGSTDNGCGLAVPACDETGDAPVCVECLENGDCPGGACVTESNTCVSCTDDAPAGGTDTGCTDAAPICFEAMTGPPTCVPCEDTAVTGRDAGCSDEAPVCDTSEVVPTCVVCDDTGSGADDGCTDAAPICDERGGAPTCIECVTSADCPGDAPVCNPASECVPGCVTDANCAATAATPICDEASMSCVECLDDAACDGDTPVCDEPVRSCVGCVEDGDCDGRCDMTTNMCVGCLDDGDCPGGVCDPASDSCLECLADADCPAGSTCGEDNVCGPQCRSDLDCMIAAPALPVCDEGDCVECVLFSDCEEGEVCTGDNTCAPECEADADCSGDLGVCLVDAGYCVECDADAGCEGDAVCDLDDFTCASGCEEDEDCAGADEVCDEPAMMCVECTRDEECLAVCDEGTNACVDCTGDDDCERGTCEDNTCVGMCATDEDCDDAARPICGDAGSCIECGADMDCDDGEICTGEVCTPGCLSDDDCLGAVCDPTSRRCVGCLDDSHCAEGEVCDPMTNTCAAQCGSDADCVEPAPRCAGEGICVGCLSEGDCPVDAPWCDEDRTCVGCRDDADCDAGTCDPESALCVEDGGCADDSACPEETPLCRDEMCVACTRDDPGVCADSELGMLCLDDEGTPRCGCDDDADCPAGYVCTESGECARPIMPMSDGGLSGGSLCATQPGARGSTAAIVFLLLAFTFTRRRVR